MVTRISSILLFLSFLITAARAQDLTFYLPDSITYNPAIPKPKEIIHHEVGEWHITHDRLVDYMQAIAAAAPSRVKLVNMGYTYESRPQLLLIFTSQANHARLEEIRQQHLRLSDPSQSSQVNTANMPVIVWIGHSIHGNEPSGSNSALLSAYYLAAAQGSAIEELLSKTIILFDPSFNPDGLQRFSTWVNQHKSKNLVTDPNNREHNEVWPGGRFNHYWFDLNRDWLPAVHQESRNRLAWFQRWKPNILTDHHEQGSNATFFFQPGVPSRVNPLTPKKNQELTAKLGEFHAAFLDRIGSLYFTKENYDDFYYGKGSTYPDVQGSIGILFEQASSRGHARETNNGILRFPFTIKNQFVTTLSTLEGALAMRQELLDYQRNFYSEAVKESSNFPAKAYVFGGANERQRADLFAEMLSLHQINVYSLAESVNAGSNRFDRGSSYIVPLDQPQHRLIRGIFEKNLVFEDSLFYDITSWTMPLAYGLTYNELRSGAYKPSLKGNKFDSSQTRISPPAMSNYGYIIEWTDYFAPAFLHSLLKEGVAVKVATNRFETGGRKFGYGTLLVPLQSQTGSASDLHQLLSELSERYKIPVIPVTGGMSTAGSDLGSSRFDLVQLPQIAMIAGQGVNATDAGEIWHLLDQRMNIPSTHLEPSAFNRVDLSKYNTIILPGGNYGDLNKDKLRSWVQSGGVLILTEEAVSWASQNGISGVNLKKIKSAVDSSTRRSYIERVEIDGAQQMNGAIFTAEIDTAHPLGYGYTNKQVQLFKANKVFPEKSKNPYATPFYYGSSPLESGWVSRENLDAIRNSGSVVVSTVGGGRVISIADNPNFRGFWLGGTRLFMNAIFFGRNIDAASARTE